MIIVGLLAVFLIAFTFAACNIAHDADKSAERDAEAMKKGDAK